MTWQLAVAQRWCADGQCEEQLAQSSQHTGCTRQHLFAQRRCEGASVWAYRSTACFHPCRCSFRETSSVSLNTFPHMYFCFRHFLRIRKQRKKEQHDKWVSIAHCILNFGICSGHGNANNVVKNRPHVCIKQFIRKPEVVSVLTGKQLMPSVRNGNGFDG